MKLKQTLDAFQDTISPDISKIVCAPCSNCKGQIRELFQDYKVGERCNIEYTGLVELIANAMTVFEKPPFFPPQQELAVETA